MSMILSPYRFAVGSADPYWSSVKLLCHFDGTNGQTTTVDSSSSAKTVTLTASVVLSTAQLKFGSTSVDLTSGGGGASVQVADSADWNFGNGQFTVEGFARIPSTYSAFITQFGGSGSYGWWLGITGGNLTFYYSTTGSDFPSVAGAWTPTAGNWYHIAADRDASNVLRVYVDGVVKASATVSATFFDTTAKLRIGNDDRLFNPWWGFIDEVRITKGVARYGGAFTPPTAAFPDS